MCDEDACADLRNRCLTGGLRRGLGLAKDADDMYDAFLADVWSLGITIFVCVAGRPPFSGAAWNDPHFRGYVRALQPGVMSDPIMQAPEGQPVSEAAFRCVYDSSRTLCCTT